ncbi:uncharacterized protein LOC118453281 isoform X2 [Egretta garzetta]|uniref:uncharacterized protein LOC118453281 isoform X2 n=1 Tax=Egretta garzetta TaxID=188379 RepID=UPI00163C6C59|nr:uncharacterized protein LOC118453281 isoform X2 [Egretta garzetta]
MNRMTWKLAWLICLRVQILGEVAVDGLITRISPRSNIWVMLANITGQSIMCVSLATPGDPFRTCLIGTPVWRPEEFWGYVGNKSVLNFTIANATLTAPGLNPQQRDGEWQAKIVENLNVTLTSPPEELDLLGCLNASSVGKQAGWFSFESPSVLDLNTDRKNWATVDSTLRPGDVYTALYSKLNQTGQPAWGIPKSPHGGPCYLGKLALFQPSLINLMQWSMSNIGYRSKRENHELVCNNDGKPKFWSTTRTVFTSLFIPAATASRAMTSLKQLACWVRDELNTTSQI